jgi:glycosyltransferase involved in cell wall biosynthesis
MSQPRQGRGLLPTVSVLIPTHNRPGWLRRALNSVLAGDYDDFEVIVSNNGRPEDTRELQRRIDDQRVRWAEQPQATGVLENFLAALSLARGRFVAVLHDDDWWDSGLLATLVPQLEIHRVAVAAFADHWRVTEDGRIDHRASEYASRASGRAALAPGLHHPFHALAVSESVPVPGCVFRREALPVESFPAEVGAAMDVWTGYLLAATGGAVYVCRERLAYLTDHASSDFATASTRNLFAAMYCQRRMLEDPRMRAHRGDLSRRLGAREQSIGASLLRAGHRHAARRHLSVALRRRPTAKGVAAWAASWLIPRSLLGRL